ncbi:hypothetical protein Tco_0921850 [Tanacetum coccineum]
MDGRGAGSCVMLGSARSGPSFLVSPLVKLSVAGHGGAGKGGSCVLIPNLVVMAKAGASAKTALKSSSIINSSLIHRICHCSTTISAPQQQREPQIRSPQLVALEYADLSIPHIISEVPK